MIKLIRENQLDLFSWNPKEVETPKEDKPFIYDGLSDTDQSKWFNTSFFKKKYDEYNTRFFSNFLPDIPLLRGRKASKTVGQCKFEGNLRTDNIRVISITLMDYNYESRFYLEQVLLHEMCHVYQIENLCKNKLSTYKKDSRQGSGSSGHGPLFFKAADMVNNSPDNTEGFKITQYEEGGHIVTKRYTTVKLNGWFKFDPGLWFVILDCIPDTPKGKEAILNSNPLSLYAYTNIETKKALQDRLGRKERMIDYASKIITDILDMIEKKDLIPLVEPKESVELFFGKNKDTGAYQLVSTKRDSVKSLYDNIEEVSLRGKYLYLQDRMLDSTVDLFKGSYFQYLKIAIKAGVYDLPDDLDSFLKEESRQLNESIESDVQEDLDELEDVKNVLDIDQHSDGSFEVIIC